MEETLVWLSHKSGPLLVAAGKSPNNAKYLAISEGFRAQTLINLIACSVAAIHQAFLTTWNGLGQHSGGSKVK